MIYIDSVQIQSQSNKNIEFQFQLFGRHDFNLVYSLPCFYSLYLLVDSGKRNEITKTTFVHTFTSISNMMKHFRQNHFDTIIRAYLCLSDVHFVLVYPVVRTPRLCFVIRKCLYNCITYELLVYIYIICTFSCMMKTTQFKIQQYR